MAISLEVWGNYACFSRPEMKVERVSYDIMTPSAARGLLEAIFWHPGMRWQIDRIRVCAPITFTNLRRNEVKSKVSTQNAKNLMTYGHGEWGIYTSQDIQQRATLMLKDVRYIIDAHFEMTEDAAPSDNPGKFQEMITRRVNRGQCYHMPYLGCREFPAKFRKCNYIPDCPNSLRGTRDLGWMLYDMDYSDPDNIRPRFFRAELRDGVLKVPDRNSEEVRG